MHPLRLCGRLRPCRARPARAVRPRGRGAAMAAAATSPLACAETAIALLCRSKVSRNDPMPLP